jgi:peptide/nickel transport system ATP-binding protein
MAGTGTAHLHADGEALLRVENLVMEFPVGRTGLRVHAVSGISFDVMKGETLGLVGESGCGKSTTGKALIHLPPPTSGSVKFDGVELTDLHGETFRKLRTSIQMIFQDPNNADRRPHQFSGGQCQRISIARALVLEPKLLICDEPVSALDVSVQAQVLNLLEDLKAKYGLTIIFIAHDLAVVKNVSDRVCVMYLGKVCEVAASDDLYARPAHPYTSRLLTSIPVPDPNVRPDPTTRLQGELPSPMLPPSGCRFRTRCPFAQDRCAEEEPQLRDIGAGHYVACHFPMAVSSVPVGAGSAAQG